MLDQLKLGLQRGSWAVRPPAYARHAETRECQLNWWQLFRDRQEEFSELHVPNAAKLSSARQTRRYPEVTLRLREF
jgi:hypothetical protein